MTRVVRILTRWLGILAGFVPSGVRSVWATIPAQLAVYILRRLVGILVAAAAIIAVGYVLMFYAPGPGPGAPAVLGAALGALAARHPRIYDGVMAMFQARYGYAHPLYNQVAQYVWHSLTFNFGTSYEHPGIPVLSQVSHALPITCELAVGALVLGLLVGVPLGVVGLKRNTRTDRLLASLSLSGQAIPSFLLAALLILFFGAVMPHILPVQGWGHTNQFVLPLFAVGVANIALVTRFTRSALIEAMRQDYMRTAEAKGVSYRHRVLKHGVKNALVALIPVVGPTFAYTLISTVWVENVFAIPGMGTLLAHAFLFEDTPVSVVAVYILAALVLLVNLCIDLARMVLDPRVRLGVPAPQGGQEIRDPSP